MKFHNGFEDIDVKLISWEGNTLAERVYKFGRLSNDYIDELPEKYDCNNPDCIKLLNKIVCGKTLPKFAFEGTRIEFEIRNISRICLAQITRDRAIFASQGGGILPLSQNFNIPMSIMQYDDVMDKVKSAQKLLEEAYKMLAEREVPALEARYIGLHSQTISLTASYEPSAFARSCFSRTSSNFCDECNYVYRKMYAKLMVAINALEDFNSRMLWTWIINEDKCINDGYYDRERLYNSDFTVPQANFIVDKKTGKCTGYAIKDKWTPIGHADTVVSVPTAMNDWRRSGWKMELERLNNKLCYGTDENYYMLTTREREIIDDWQYAEKLSELHTTYDSDARDVLKNAIKERDYYEE